MLFLFKAGKKGIPGLSMYSSSKAALDMLTRTMAMELGKDQIRVNSVNPGGIDTDMLNQIHQDYKNLTAGGYAEELEELFQFRSRIPLGKGLIDMSDVVNLTLFVLSGMVHMLNGETIVLDGGFTLA